MAEVLVRNAPSKARTANERMQADEIYKPGTNLRVRILYLVRVALFLTVYLDSYT